MHTLDGRSHLGQLDRGTKVSITVATIGDSRPERGATSHLHRGGEGAKAIGQSSRSGSSPSSRWSCSRRTARSASSRTLVIGGSGSNGVPRRIM